MTDVNRERLIHLVETARRIRNGDNALPDEAAAIRAWTDARVKATEAAEEGVMHLRARPWPMDIYPPEYQAVLKELAEVEALLDAHERWRKALMDLHKNPFAGWSGGRAEDLWDIVTMPDRVDGLLREVGKRDLWGRREVLRESKERKHREGTKALRATQAEIARRQVEETRLRDKVWAQVIGENKGAELEKAARAAELAMDRRKREAMARVRDSIIEVLKGRFQ